MTPPPHLEEAQVVEPGIDEIELARLIETFMQLLHQMSAGDTLALMHESGLTLPQMVALHVTRNAGPVPLSLLGDVLRLSPSAVSHLVDRLVERQMLDRSEDPDDRRQKRLVLAPAGEELLSRLDHSRIDDFRNMLAQMDPVSRPELASLLTRLTEIFRQSARARCRPGGPR